MEDNKYYHIQELINATQHYQARDMDGHFEFLNDYKNKYPEMAYQLKTALRNHLSESSLNSHRLGNSIDEVLKTHWQLAPHNLTLSIMLSMLEKPRPHHMEPEEVVKFLRFLLNMAQMTRNNISHHARSNDPWAIAFQTLMTLLPDLCMSLLPGIINHVERRTYD